MKSRTREKGEARYMAKPLGATGGGKVMRSAHRGGKAFVKERDRASLSGEKCKCDGATGVSWSVPSSLNSQSRVRTRKLRRSAISIDRLTALLHRDQLPLRQKATFPALSFSRGAWC